MDLLARLDRCEGPRARPDRLEEERELARWRLAEAHRARQEPAGRLEHEELPGHARVDVAALHADERVGADRLVGDDSKPASSAH